MKHGLYFPFLVFASLCCAAPANDAPLVRVGDSVAAVRNHLGEPSIEFPLHGQLVQDYGNYVITSRNGVVVAVRRRNDPDAAEDKEMKEQSGVPTIKSLTDRAYAGEAEAQYSLAYCYHSGTVVSKNMEAAIRWYTLAAMQGHTAARHNLSVIYMTGDGVERDLEQAYVWASLAADSGSDDLSKKLRPLLTGEQEHAACTRAARIRSGREESPYGLPESSASVARKKAAESPPAE